MSDGISMAERRPPRPSGIDGVKGEIERLRADAIAAVRERAEQFFAEFECNPSNKVLADWFVPRCWREIEYVFMLGEEIRRYGLLFDRTHITALAKHLQQEAEHYEAVGRIIEHLGGAVPTEVPPSARVWSAYLWDCLDRHPLSAIAAW